MARSSSSQSAGGSARPVPGTPRSVLVLAVGDSTVRSNGLLGIENALAVRLHGTRPKLYGRISSAANSVQRILARLSCPTLLWSRVGTAGVADAVRRLALNHAAGQTVTLRRQSSHGKFQFELRRAIDHHTVSRQAFECRIGHRFNQVQIGCERRTPRTCRG